MNQYDDISEVDLTPEEKEAIRRAREAQAQAPAPTPAASAPTRVSEMPLGPAPGGVPNFSESMANLLDPQGRRVLNPSPEALRPFAGRLSNQEMLETGPAADAFSAQLAAYNATPRNEALFAAAAPGPYGYEPGRLTVPEEDALIAAGKLPPIHERPLAPRVEQQSPAVPGQDPFFQPDAFMSAAEERMTK